MTQWEAQMRANIDQGRASDPEGQDAVRAEFLDGAEQFLDEYQDVIRSETMVRKLLETDSKLADEFPKLAPLQRLRVAGNHVRAGSFEPADVQANHSMAIQDMKAGRASQRAEGWSHQSEFDAWRTKMRGP